MEFKLLNDLEFISAEIGADPMLIQGPGGNSSLKVGEEMFIKASGKWLEDAKKNNIFVNVDWKTINQNIIQKKKDPIEGTIISSSTLRPSIETTLHALMPHRVVLHTHPIELLSLLVLEKAKIILNNLLSDCRWLWVDYFCPGIDLTRKIKQELSNQTVDIIILGNHGLVVGSDTCEGVVNMTKELSLRFKQPKRSPKMPNKHKLFTFAKKLNMRPANDFVIHSLAVDDQCYKHCNTKSTVLYPDQAVFLGSRLNCIEPEQVMKENLKRASNDYIILGKTGVFVANNTKLEIEKMLKCHSEILLRVPSNQSLKYLTSKQVKDLVGWEAEIYRQNIKR